MDSMVTARVPQELKSHVGEILKDLGSTPTKLVNLAYEYVAKTHELPKVPSASPLSSSGVKWPDKTMMHNLEECFALMDISDFDETDGTFEEQLREMRHEDLA